MIGGKLGSRPRPQQQFILLCHPERSRGTRLFFLASPCEGTSKLARDQLKEHMSTNVPGPIGSPPQPTIGGLGASPAAVAPTPTAAKRFAGIMGHALAITLWTYAFVKLLAFDIDQFVADRFFPNYAWLLDYKFLFVIGAIAAIWLLTKPNTILLWLAFIVLYPVLLALWYLPKFLLKRRSWILTFATINAVLSFSTSLRFNFITFSVFLISFVVAVKSSDVQLLWPAMTLMFLILGLLYIHRFSMIFRPSSVFLSYRTIFAGVNTFFKKNFVRNEDTKQLSYEQLPVPQQQVWLTNLQMFVLFNRACLFTSKKLRDFQSSQLNLISYVLSLLMILILTAIGFAAINCALYKIDPKSFSVIGRPTFFIFFYYSFKTFLFGGIREVTALTPISESIAMVEYFLAILLTLILVSLFIFVRGDRFTSELNGVIENIEREGAGMEDFIQNEYLLNVDGAIARLRELNAGLVDLVYQISSW
jgi:hypothetical protein